MEFFKGQGATEYLVLLAVVLIVALVSVALLGFFPGMASDARITQSQAYWRGQAKPFAIQEASLVGTGGNMSVQNVEASGPYTITALVLGGTTVNITGSTVAFGGGELKLVGYVAGPTCAAGTIYDYNVTITYNTPTITGAKQYSSKNLVGKCT